MKILVTGGAGFIGSMLVPQLLSDGHDVTVLDNFRYNQTPFNHLCMISNLKIMNGDVRDWHNGSPMRKALDGVECIIPLAALVGAPLCDQDKDGALGTNYHAVKKLVNSIPKDVKVIIPISNSGYGVGEKDKFCTENTPMRPISLYGRTKVDAENACFEYHENTVSLRLATVFGMSPRMRLDLLVNEFVYRAVNDRVITLFEPHFRRNYIHLRDVVKTFLFAIDNFDNMSGKAFNVGLSNANLSKYELCSKIQKHLPKFVFNVSKIGEDPDKRDYIVSNAKLEALGWYPHYSLDEGIQELIKGFVYLKRSEYGNF